MTPKNSVIVFGPPNDVARSDQNRLKIATVQERVNWTDLIMTRVYVIAINVRQIT